MPNDVYGTRRICDGRIVFKTCLLATLLEIFFFASVESIQCYSCKATATNEIEANVHCLEAAALEDCNDFYHYYDEVEDSAVQSFDQVDQFEYHDVAALHHNTPRRPRRQLKQPAAKQKKELKNTKAQSAELQYDYRAGEDYQYRNDDGKKGVTTTRGSVSGGKSTSVPGKAADGTANVTTDSSGQQTSLPTDREHHCYSMTRKNNWESYTVEKGCKKIAYCKTHEANLPDWSMPWNFCCDKSRCNAKLVKDKPQRIFAMGCRRTDDCIQGHNTRHVCPEMYQSCPKVSMNVVKMECRMKIRPASTSRNTANYFSQFKEKKCFCARGFYPKGPVCTSTGSSQLHSAQFGSVAIMLALACIPYAVWS